MDSQSQEQTELLRNIWNQIKELDHNLGRRIDRTNDEVAGLKVEMVGVKQEIGGVKLEMAGVKQEIVGLRTDVDGLKVEMVGVKQEIVGVKQEIKAVRVATQSGFELLSRAQARRDGDIGELRERLDRVEVHVGLRPR